MIKAIIFDLSEVCLRGLFGTHKLLTKKLKISINSQNLHIPELQKLFYGEIYEEDYLKALILKYNWNIKIPELKKIIRSNFREIRGTRGIIKLLKKKGYKLGLLSVHAREWINYCEKKFKYRQLFNSIIYSFEVGVCKPEQQAYQLILKKLKVQPKECLVIDDGKKNLKTAIKLNMQVIQFKSSTQLKIRLKSLKILS